MRVPTLALLSSALLVATMTPSSANPCQIQTVRSVQGQTVCIYNCAGRTKTVTSAGNFCPVILE